MSMNIYSPEGTKVIALFDNDGNLMNGHDSEKEAASQHLEPNKVYTVDKTEVHSWYTKVYLKDFPNVSFNSVHFEEYIEPKTSFTLEDMQKCFVKCDMEHAARSGHGLSIDTFNNYMKETYNIDITK
jgi:hypothetical protein